MILLLAAVLLLGGFEQGAQLSVEEAESAAAARPEVAEILRNPTVEPEAEYRPESDTWRVAFGETVSSVYVAEVLVEDDTGEVSEARTLPTADTVEYPQTGTEEAIRVAEADPEIRETLPQFDSYNTQASYQEPGEEGNESGHAEWRVSFYSDSEREDEVARVGVNDETWQLEYVWTGEQVRWNMARGIPGSYGAEANHPLVWGTLALLFVLAFGRKDRTFSLRNFDLLALLGFLVSHSFFRDGDAYWATLLIYPSLIYLFFRTLALGFGYGERVRQSSNLPTPLLFVLGAIAAGALIALNIRARVIDVGYASVAGADRIMNGIIPYGNMPEDVSNGDTYGPLTYVIYAPANYLFGYSGEWDYLPSAHAVSIAALVLTAAALIYAGHRLAGWQGAGVLFFAWTVYPYTVYTTNNNTNDILLALFAAAGLAAFSNPALRGAAVAAGFAAKLGPAILAPLWLAHDGLRLRPALRFVLGGVGVVIASFWVLGLTGDFLEGARLFYERTFAFQSGRESPWSIYGQVPATLVLQRPLQVTVVLLALALMFVPRVRSVRRLAALSAALLIGFQLTLDYWFYPYISWFSPFLFVALLLATERKTPLDQGQAHDRGTGVPEDPKSPV